MSRIFGPIRQMGYVVRDIEAAMRHWTEALGVGPFYCFDAVVMKDFRFRGEAHDIELSIALANSGEVQVELIQQRNAAPSLYLERLASHGEALHHVSAWSTDYDADLRRITDAGHRPVQEARIGRNRLAYFVAGDPSDGTIYEIYDISGRAGELNERIRLAAQDWDGREPVRRMG